MIDLYDLSSTYPLLKHSHSKEPLWGSDAGRNSNSAKFSGTFKGYFSQLVIEFGKTNQTQMSMLRNKFEHSIINVKYKDSTTGNWKIEEFYGTAIKADLDDWDGKYLPFSITLTAVNKYS